MIERPIPASVLITGVYGTGKSTLAAELAEILEHRGQPFAAIDLDWLMWFLGADERVDAGEVMLRNLAAVVDNYVGVGVRFFIVAGTIREPREVEALRALLPSPMLVVRLTVPAEVIAERLRHDAGSGRLGDLQVARQDLAAGAGEGIEDIALANDGAVAGLAGRVLGWLGWADAGPSVGQSRP